MPRLHLAETSNSSGSKRGGPGSALQNVQNLQPRARRAPSSSRCHENTNSMSEVVPSGADDGEGQAAGAGETLDIEDFSEFDSFDFGGFDYDDTNEGSRVPTDPKKGGEGEASSMEFSSSHYPKQDSSSLSTTSMIGGNHISVSKEAPKGKRKKDNAITIGRSKKKNVVSISPKRTPTVSSRKITLSSLSSTASSDISEVDQIAIASQNGKKKTPESTPSKGVKENVNQAQDKENKSSIIRSRKKNSTVNQQKKLNVTFGPNEKSSNSNNRKSSKTVVKRQSKGPNATSNNGNASKKGVNKESKEKSRPKPQDKRRIFFDDESDCFNSTDDENDKQQAISKKSNPKTRKISLDAHSINNSPRKVSNDDHIQVLPLRAIAIDNRALPTVDGDTMARCSLLSHIPNLVNGALEKGILFSDCTGNNSIIATLSHESKNSQQIHTNQIESGHSIAARAAYLFENRKGNSSTASTSLSKKERESWLSSLLTPINNVFGNESMIKNYENYSDDGFFLEGCSAVDSWRYFGDLVEAIVNEFPLKKGAHQHPYAITIFTTDAAVFSDTNSTSHLKALDQFWNRISSLCHKQSVSTVAIMVVETASVKQMMDALKTPDVHGDPQSPTQLDPGFIHKTGTHSFGSSIPNRLHVMQCVNDIRQRIKELSEIHSGSDYVAEMVPSVTHTSLRLEFMEGNPVSFQSLLQMWTKESFAQTYANINADHNVSGVYGRLCFDLPETIDGIMCSISLDLQYKSLPYSIDSSSTLNLVNDMQKFHSSSFEVMQTMPLSSVDASLIFGVPMSARAGLESDISRYNEMKMLVRQLWKHLSRNELALVLRLCPEPVGSDKEDCGKITGSQLFLLICEDNVEMVPAAFDQGANCRADALDLRPEKDRKGHAPCHGVLYQYATKSQILHHGIEEMNFEDEEDDNATEMGEQYRDYIERSLDMTSQTGLNPFLDGPS